MKQTRKASLIESLTNVAIGYFIGVVTNLIVLPLFGFPISFTAANEMSLVFTVVSIVRSFMLRRGFEALRISGWLM